MDPDGAAALHVFDMDGTLLVGTTASREIASMHGSEAQLLALERRFAAGEIDTRAFAVAIHQLWHDLRPEMVAAAFAAHEQARSPASHLRMNPDGDTRRFLAGRADSV